MLGRTSLTKLPCTGARAKSTSPAEASNSPTATRNTSSAGRTSLVIDSSSGSADTTTGPRLPNIAIAVRPGSGALRPRAVPSSAACRGVTPGFNRAMPLKILIERPLLPGIATGGTRIGVHARVSRSGK